VIHRYRSAAATPYDRGRDFGQVHREPVRSVFGHYQELLSLLADRPVELADFGDEALGAITAFSADAASEIRGIADGAGLDAQQVAALNARTEIMARLRVATHGECSTVVQLSMDDRAPVTVQTWDWHELIRDDWLVWSIEHPDGTAVHTVTEFGILGKIGVNNRGIGTHFNILHHTSDGGAMGVPVHVLSRIMLDQKGGLGDALTLVGAAETSASTVLTVIAADDRGTTAMCVELSPVGPRFVLPDQNGLLLHTNHFLDPYLAAGDMAPRQGPDSYARLEVLRRRLSERPVLKLDDILSDMASHLCPGGSICCHAPADADLVDQWSTLATVTLDVPNGALNAMRGGPCAVDAEWTTVGG
jgi:isopenicillin-N N-acyltransferase-like protein